MNRDQELAAVAAIRDPTRRALYELTLTSTQPVTRDHAAATLGMPRSTAALHLDQLVASGLLVVENRRLSGRTGPGAGRPAKVYSRAPVEIAVTLPARRYDLMADVFASALDDLGSGEADHAGEAAVAAAVHRVAGDAGAQARLAAGSLDEMLVETGYEPRRQPDGIALDNCPFHRLAGGHTELVCAANLAFLRGAADADGAGATAEAQPFPAHGCCVRIVR
ncbi:helix-turn-helix domain-containing protein [Pseudolysinimonas kribbensis]|uniref:ArsR family transcriptional regulator n=1 Tax=Pseudolysinimonas kribbensis TaxID=433641 RepID=A0ABQ6K5K2_9MICO|nr:helix-turn-helix domain-containing protein [Pseudolysinimonas kribbensis]GMA95895.1 ArsR family transcriptional regulator [Pseudolysinimonas kribbensis]